ncbi:MAG TPA: glycosyltransferase [Tepidisphaeraceae bacterium]|nr:glycosyltransferase [Tepidisphaeraceae bacterium]
MARRGTRSAPTSQPRKSTGKSPIAEKRPAQPPPPPPSPQVPPTPRAEAVVQAVEALASDPAPPETQPPVPDPTDAVLTLTAPPPPSQLPAAIFPAIAAPALEPSLSSDTAPPAPKPHVPPPPQPPMLLEVAWEVCWQLGGIYTVLRTKAATMVEKWGDRYCLIGPYNPATAPVEFEELPAYGQLKQTVEKLQEAGLPCYFGRWLVAGRPRVILIDYRARYWRLDGDKFLMWNDHHISLPAGDGELNEVVAFGFAVAEFFQMLAGIVTDRPILAHFHEWMGGVAVPRIAHMGLPIATVFTTHATLLGRYLASDNPYFYDHLQFIDPDKEAAKFNIYPRFAIERAAAHASTVFTTVSEVTATEAGKILGRQPDGILPNGLNIQRFAAPHEFQYLHQRYKEKINEFIMGHFFPSYTFDIDNTVYLFTSGRYEYRNKGMDMFVEVMYRLNQRLKGLPDRPTVVAFCITKAATRSINVGVLQSQSMFEDLEHTCTEIQEQMGNRLFQAIARGRMPGFAELLPDDSQVRLKRALHAWRLHRQPPIITHDLADDANDPILKHLRARGLFNAADDPVKFVYHPDFIAATSPLLNLDYDQFVRGCHMGIFPSYYEPWGYTPMECVALGLPAVTSDLSGFGAYVERHIPDHESRGILVLRRRQRSFDDACNHLVEYLLQFLQLNRRQRIELRNKVERLGEMFDWSTLVRHYDEAHDLALQRIGAPRQGKIEIRFV